MLPWMVRCLLLVFLFVLVIAENATDKITANRNRRQTFVLFQKYKANAGSKYGYRDFPHKAAYPAQAVAKLVIALSELIKQRFVQGHSLSFEDAQSMNYFASLARSAREIAFGDMAGLCDSTVFDSKENFKEFYDVEQAQLIKACYNVRDHERFVVQMNLLLPEGYTSYAPLQPSIQYVMPNLAPGVPVYVPAPMENVTQRTVKRVVNGNEQKGNLQSAVNRVKRLVLERAARDHRNLDKVYQDSSLHSRIRAFRSPSEEEVPDQYYFESSGSESDQEQRRKYRSPDQINEDKGTAMKHQESVREDKKMDTTKHSLILKRSKFLKQRVNSDPIDTDQSVDENVKKRAVQSNKADKKSKVNQLELSQSKASSFVGKRDAQPKISKQKKNPTSNLKIKSTDKPIKRAAVKVSTKSAATTKSPLAKKLAPDVDKSIMGIAPSSY